MPATYGCIMAETTTLEVSEEVKSRLFARAEGDAPADAVVSELLDEIEYLERVNDLATDGNWPGGDYY